MYREQMVQGSGRPSGLIGNNVTGLIGNNVTEVERVTGNSRAYSIARVKKDCDPQTVAEALAMYREEMVQSAGRPSGLIHDIVMNKSHGTSRAGSLAMYREEMVEKPGGFRRPIADIVSNDGKVDSGNARAYSIARVKKDCDPDTVAEALAMYREEMKAQHGGDKRS